MKDIFAVKLAKSCSMYRTTTKTHIFWKKWSLQNFDSGNFSDTPAIKTSNHRKQTDKFWKKSTESFSRKWPAKILIWSAKIPLDTRKFWQKIKWTIFFKFLCQNISVTQKWSSNWTNSKKYISVNIEVFLDRLLP